QPQELFAVFSVEVRVRVLCLLQLQPLCICDLKEIIKAPLETIHRHLRILKQVGLIEVKRSRPWATYSLSQADDPKLAMALGILAIARTESPRLIADAKAAKSKHRPACK